MFVFFTSDAIFDDGCAIGPGVFGPFVRHPAFTTLRNNDEMPFQMMRWFVTLCRTGPLGRRLG